MKAKILVVFLLLSISGLAQKQMTVELDLRASNLDLSHRIFPATFETVTETYEVLDEIDESGFYTLDSMQIRAKDPYIHLTTSFEIDTIFFNGDPVLFTKKSIVQEEKITDSKWSHRWLKFYKLSSGKNTDSKLIPFKKLSKKFGNNFSKTYTFHKLVMDATATEMYVNAGLNSDKITLNGEKKALKKWLKQPALKGLKYRKN